MTTFSLRLPDVGVAQRPGLLRGYVRPVAGGRVVMHVSVPPRGAARHLQVYVHGRLVPHSLRGRLVVFSLVTRAGRAANWAVEG